MPSYLTPEEGDIYFAGRLRSESWDSATADEKLRALNMATRAIDNLRFVGDKTDLAQDNEFPRGSQGVTPQAIKDACAEMALALLDGFDPEIERDNLSAVSQGMSSARTTFDKQYMEAHKIAGFPVVAWNLLVPYLVPAHNLKINRAS